MMAISLVLKDKFMKNNQKEIENKIARYNPRKPVVIVLRNLGEIGYKFSRYDCVQDDQNDICHSFVLNNGKYRVTVRDRGKITVSIFTIDKLSLEEEDFITTPAQAVNFLKEALLFNDAFGNQLTKGSLVMYHGNGNYHMGKIVKLISKKSSEKAEIKIIKSKSKFKKNPIINASNIVMLER